MRAAVMTRSDRTKPSRLQRGHANVITVREHTTNSVLPKRGCRQLEGDEAKADSRGWVS